MMILWTIVVVDVDDNEKKQMMFCFFFFLFFLFGPGNFRRRGNPIPVGGRGQ